MGPSFVMNDIENCDEVNIVATGQPLHVSRAVPDVKLSDFSCLLRSEFRHYESVAVRMSAFIVAILIILRLRSNPKVGWVYASPNIAFVENPQTVWDWPIVQKPRGFRSSYRFCAAAAAFPNLTITNGRFRSSPSPKPAWTKLWLVWWNRAVLVYLFPKSFLERIRKTWRKCGMLSKYAWHRSKFIFDSVLCSVAAATAPSAFILREPQAGFNNCFA
jgi:hypothetical protein